MNSDSYLIHDEYSIKCVSDPAVFEELGGVWNRLANKHGGYMPFLCFDWFKIWVDHFLNNHKLMVLLLCKSEEVLGIAPCLIKKEKFKGINVRKIELIGNVYSPFRYLLFNEFRAEERIANLSLFFQFLASNNRNWDIFELSSVPEEFDLFRVLELAIRRTNLKYVDFVCFGDWYLDEIQYSGDQYFLNLPKKIKKDVLYCQRRLQNMGACEVRLVRNGENIDHYMDLYYQVYGRSWQKEEGVGPGFHRDLAKMAAKNDWLRLGFLMLDGSPIASQFWISCNGTAYVLKTVYDQDYKKFSPGKILTSELIKHVIDMDKVTTIDYVQGDEAYKQDWTPKRRERKGLFVFNRSIRGEYLNFLFNKIRPAVSTNKYLRQTKEIAKKILAGARRIT